MEIDIVDKDKKTTIVFFAGIAGGLGVPQYEFVTLSKSLDCNIIFVKDDKQLWYSKAGDGPNGNVNNMVQVIDTELKKLNSSKIVFCGNSMGGYAALLFSRFIKVDKVLVFSPQVVLNPLRLFTMLDFRWYFKMTNSYFNFKLTLNKSLSMLLQNENAPIDVYVGANEKNDLKHVRNLPSYINVFKVENADHNLIKYYRDKGKLLELLRRNIA